MMRMNTLLSPALTRRSPWRALATISVLVSGLALSSCTTPSSASSEPEKRIQDIENERNPIVEADCLEGEYYDSATESCEPTDPTPEQQQK